MEHGSEELIDQTRPEILLDFAIWESVKLKLHWELRCRLAYSDICVL
jgi:hypothetical protein